MKTNEIEYLNEHHQLTEQAIGIAKLQLKNGQYVKALQTLNNVVNELDQITKKYLPATSKLMGLTDED